MCGKVIKILSPLAFKWDLLSRLLKFPDDMRIKIANAKGNNEKKLESMIRQWWHINKGKERCTILCSVLFYELKAEELAREVWKCTDEGHNLKSRLY